MNLITEHYLAQNDRWPRSGRHILAQFDAESVVVYQAYRPEIGLFAARHGYFGGAFSLGRMSWIKPNFLWMMFRSGWGTKEGQEVTLAVRLKRDAFDEILRLAIHSSFTPEVYGTQEEWRRAVAGSDVRRQWDPDHGPAGNPLKRRAIQLGLRGDVLARYAKEWLLDIEDISEFVAEQRARAIIPFDRLVAPQEDVYPVAEPRTMKQLRAFLEGKTGPADPGHRLASYMLDYIAGKRSEESMEKYWDRAFAEPSGTRMTG